MEFYKASLPEIAMALSSGELDLMDYIQETIQRVELTDTEVRAFMPEPGRKERLLADAAALLQKYPDPADRPALFGVPVGVKDLFRVDGFPTRAGSYLPPEAFVGPEASFITRIKELGAIVLGKTDMDEFAHSEPPLTRNPRNLKHSPGGSSGGSAAASALGLCPVAIGTQTCMSIIGPASFCGTVGYKPSWGSIPVDGMVMMSASIDTIGFLAQDVASVTLAASLLIEDLGTAEIDRKPVLGIPESSMRADLHDYAEAAYQQQLAQLERAGYEVRPVKFFESDYIKDIFNHTSNVLHYEMAKVHSKWFASYEPLYRKRTHAAIKLGQSISEAQYLDGKAAALEFRARIAELMDLEGVELWVLPGTNGVAPEGYQVTGWISQTGPWSFAGLGSVVIPAGLAPNGLPLGLQFIPKYKLDAQLLAWTKEIEKVFG
jgi:Asp-tRNA(Asn)/Glu-tRNA(Gln) amidotransferase A subunit family amidase